MFRPLLKLQMAVYPVNCIAFHPRFRSSFVTGGCDGALFIWDGINKKKLSTISSFPTSISSLAFNWDGTELAVASSYTFGKYIDYLGLFLAENCSHL